MITKVTITGADDSITPIELGRIWNEYPFVEWGILVSKSNYDTPRFPSQHWLRGLSGVKMDVKDLPLSMHLCGSYVRELVKGNIDLTMDLWTKMFDRIQLNFHAIPHEHWYSMTKVFEQYGEHEFIFQYDGVNDELVRIAAKGGQNVSALFDKSGGAGILPTEWPKPLEGIRCGYAGGLSPENLEQQIKLIEEKVGDTEIWIDMETHVRSQDDKLFDLKKVLECLRIAAPYVKSK